MVQHDDCGDVAIGGTFYGEAIAICIAFFLQSMLFAHSVYNHWINQRDSKRNEKRPFHVLLHILLLLLGVCYLLSAMLYMVIDPLFPFLRNTPLCSATVIITRNAGNTFYSVYLAEILSRIHTAFKYSDQAIPKWFLYSMTIIIAIGPFVIVSAYISSSKYCMMEWIPIDHDPVYYCTDYSVNYMLAAYIYMTVIIIENVMFGIIFISKLRPIVKRNHDVNSQVEAKFKALIIKVESAKSVDVYTFRNISLEFHLLFYRIHY